MPILHFKISDFGEIEYYPVLLLSVSLIMEELECAGYAIETVPKTAADEEKTTITGNDLEYVEAQKVLKNSFKKKGERFLINEIEVTISDTPKNRPMIIGVKPKDGITGKVNLRYFDINNRGGATIMVQKAKGGDTALVKILSIKVVKYLLDRLIEGSLKETEIEKFQLKTQVAVDIKTSSVGEHKCPMCKKSFRTEQGIKLHMTRMHEGNINCRECKKTFQTEQEIMTHLKREHTGEKFCEPCEKNFPTDHELKVHNGRLHKDKENIYCEVCRITLKGEVEFKAHLQIEHSELVSPNAKKRKHDPVYKLLEEKSSEIVVLDENEDVLEMEVDNKDADVRKTLEEKRDEKVLFKQKTWFEEEIKFQEMKKKQLEERMKQENKRKREISLRKRKNSEAKKKAKDYKDEFINEPLEVVVKVVEEPDGPGYMGWSTSDKEKEEESKDLSMAFEEIKSLFKLYQSMEMQFQGSSKQINNLKKEVKDLKEEYKQCLDALSNETYERNKAEAKNKALKETIEAERKLNDARKETTLQNSIEEENLMDVSQGWTVKRKDSRKKSVNHNCSVCNNMFKTKCELEQHTETVHVTSVRNICEECNSMFKTITEMETHVKRMHSQTSEVVHKCSKCDQTYNLEEELNVHMVTIHAERVFNCQKCNKPYESMALLRRHDWRCHREIECNMCGEYIKSRMDIKTHRETKHQMYQKVYCRFFPACIDGNECLFEHAQNLSEVSYCPNGQMCNDQTCKFSEQRHEKGNVLCTFQTNCNRLNCPFIHTVERKAFLGEGQLRILRN